MASLETTGEPTRRAVDGISLWTPAFYLTYAKVYIKKKQ